METIKVNMTPCEDIKTIHASQNDNEAREWGFELHNNGDAIDSSEITDQIVFKAYEGGTEELLPSSLMNGSIDLGSLTWTYMPNNYFRSSAVISDAKIPSNENTVANILCSILKPNTANNVYANNEGIAIDGTGRIRIYYDDMPTDVASFTQAMQGVLLWYEKSDSTPTTTPFLGDIKYPQGLLTNQQFTYRESPTEEDGLANIVDIEGQTLKWNQLVSSASGWVSNNGTLSQSGNTYTYTVTALGDYDYQNRMQRAFPFVIPKGHKMFLSCEFYYPRNTPILIYMIRAGASGVNRSIGGTTVANQWTRISGIQYDTSTEFGYYQLALATIASNGYSVGDSVQVRNPMAIDLTMLFGEGNEPTTVDEFKSLFPLDYYDFNIGSLIPFMGNGIKTTGKNLVSLALSPASQQRVAGVTIQSQTNEEFTVTSTGSGTYSNLGLFYNLKKGTYTVKFQAEASDSFAPIMTVYGYNGGIGQVVSNSIPRNTARTFTLTEDKMVEFRCFATTTSAVRTVRFYDFQLEFGSTATAYEPYTESVINLPISTYFPNGMNSVPKAYDELIPSKATQRAGRILMQNLQWSMISSGVFSANLSNVPPSWTRGGTGVLLSPLYTEESWGSIDTGTYTDKSIHGLVYSNFFTLRVYDSSCTTLEQFTTKITNVPLLYELATPTETEITTASLVTENGEIPLSNEDGVLIGKCNEQLSSESGFFDAQIKLTDSDGDVYSNKIQLHVERKP